MIVSLAALERSAVTLAGPQHFISGYSKVLPANIGEFVNLRLQRLRQCPERGDFRIAGSGFNPTDRADGKTRPRGNGLSAHLLGFTPVTDAVCQSSKKQLCGIRLIGHGHLRKAFLQPSAAASWSGVIKTTGVVPSA